MPKSIFYFLLARLMEIGGGYLMWLWIREKWASWLGLIGALIIVGYGVVPTLQPAHFGRVYAAYGGVFIILSIFWGWLIDGVKPDASDLIGMLFCLVGVGFIMYTLAVARDFINLREGTFTKIECQLCKIPLLLKDVLV